MKKGAFQTIKLWNAPFIYRNAFIKNTKSKNNASALFLAADFFFD
jgi:hypothetical protein